MRHFSPGLSDSIASVIADPAQCPHCASSSCIGGGLCVGCLLQAGLAADDECAPETLSSALAEITLPDKNWRLGNYEILEEIGRGGMGVIYRARQRHSRRIVAVKRILGYHADSRETLARFRREAQAAASLDHPNILPIYEVSQSEDGLPFFSMKFAPGGNLQEVGPALRNDPRQCVSLVAKIARAVQHAHGKGILHRDLKPGNILLDAHGEPLVSDFGLAKWLDTTSDLTRTLTIFGTPGYIAPEQASGSAAQLRPAADVYSLGAILFDLLAGRPPFLGSHALSVIRQAAETTAPKLRSLSKVADRDLETICARCLEREPSARYRSAHDLAEDLERWLEGRPIIARPVLSPVRVWRWVRRNPILACFGAAVILLVVTGVTQIIARSRLSSIVEKAETARRSVAIIPFEDLDDLSTTGNAARSITDAFSGGLQHTKTIQVIQPPFPIDVGADPANWEQWRTIGETTGARMVLGGSIRQHDGKRRVAIHLVESATGSVVQTWLQEADKPSEIVTDSLGRIADLLRNTKAAPLTTARSPNISEQDLNAAGETKSSLARSYFDRGEQFLSRYNLPDLDRAIESFRKSVEIDPSFAIAHAMLATACQARAQVEPTGQWLVEAQAAAATALKIAPLLPEGHRAQGSVLRRLNRLRDSIDSFLTAYELDPTTGRTAVLLGDVHQQIGRPDLAISWFEKAGRRLSQPTFADNMGHAWIGLGEYDDAEKAFKAATIFKPDMPAGLLGLSLVALYREDFDSARKFCEQARTKFSQNPEPLEMAALIEFFSRNFAAAEGLYRKALAANRKGGVDQSGSVRYLSAIGMIEQSSPGRHAIGDALLEEARTLDEQELHFAPDNLRRLYSLAANHAALGQKEEAMRDLNRAIAAGWIDYRALTLDPRFNSICDLDGFKDSLNRLTNKVEEMRRQRPSRELVFNPK